MAARRARLLHRSRRAPLAAAGQSSPAEARKRERIRQLMRRFPFREVKDVEDPGGLDCFNYSEDEWDILVDPRNSGKLDDGETELEMLDDLQRALETGELTDKVRKRVENAIQVSFEFDAVLDVDVWKGKASDHPAFALDDRREIRAQYFVRDEDDDSGEEEEEEDGSLGYSFFEWGGFAIFSRGVPG